VSLALPEGSALGLLGPNGAGKTTALRLILGHVHPSQGEVRLQGLDPYLPASREEVGYLPERLVLPHHQSVGAFLNLHAGLADARRAGEVEAVAERTGVGDRLGDPLGSLSKGLAQRVGFAQALLGRPRILLLDEPSTGLDPIGMREARSWIAEAKDAGSSVLVSSHLLSEVERICDRIAILHEGRIISEGAIEEIVEEGEDLEDAFVRLVAGGSGGSAHGL
jgi:ABC-2 type transport system ATP-binding protein